MVSLLQTNELLGNYRNLFWFGNPVSLPLVEWLTAAVLGGSLFAAFCAVFAEAQLLPAARHSFALPFSRKTRATSVTHEEGRKLLLMNGASVFLAAFLVFGIYQGVTAESYIDADEIYYAYYSGLRTCRHYRFHSSDCTEKPFNILLFFFICSSSGTCLNVH